ncbi:MAG: DUF447 family protein [Nitrososphaerota archaeon]|jgi:hypothetical protein|nr:DUF447 family protein [Nitrososphaerota archaeon]
MVALVDLGFSKDAVYEIIVCTYNQDGTSNAAPMGVVMQDFQHVLLTIYNSATTLKNLQIHRLATLNLTGDIDIFFQTALKDISLPMDWFKKSDKIGAPQLKQADATIDVTVQDFVPLDNQRTIVISKVQQITALTCYPQSYCRAKFAVLEAIIHATRVKAFINIEKEQAYVAKLVDLIQNCAEVVNRSAPHSHYAKLMIDLQKKIDTWGKR